MTLKIQLPWPDSRLSPNARIDRRARAVYVATARALAAAETLRQCGPVLPILPDCVAVRLTFCPPDARARDLDNCLSANKAHLDGVAQALDANDRQFRPVTLDWGQRTQGGVVVVEIDA